ncbi:TetR family transcriptional regulator [Micrococcales bacterium 31B]|nr:TetR family transcriptional regulator [Micrococcales bacterium 31B]
MATPRKNAADKQRDAARTRSEILRVATEEFAEQGFSGARVDVIAERTSSTKRMLYYYFGSKEGLYSAVLEKAYGQLRSDEQGLDLAHLEPLAGVLALADHTFDHHLRNDHFLRLVAIENIHRAKYLRASETAPRQNSTVINALTDLLERGQRDSQFNPAVDAVDVHLAISAFCVFLANNRHTFGALFDRDLTAADRREHYRAMLHAQLRGLLLTRASDTP